ncbi:LuxR C-terminal-related transcriptional regulator [Mycobacterium sp. pV006]|uniref:LuxR C-terminal-related transcriptional regulator n=1 Tax=Mycobacterium sp. pV006 TaxID=3238983 RepID=UPI00351BE662
MRFSWPLIGRTDELRRLEAALSNPGVSGVVLSGSAGVGKSRLLSEIRTTADARGFLTRLAVGTSSARTVPLGALAPWASPQASDTLSSVRAVTASLCAAPRGARVLLLVDDAHLLDELSMFVLHQIALRRAATLVFTVLDDAPIPAALQDIWKLGRFDNLRLEPLPRDATAELSAAVLGGAVAADTADRLWHLTRGNALYLRTILEQEVDQGRIVEQHGRWCWTADPVLPPSLVALIETRLSDQTADVAAVLDVLAVAEPLALSVLEPIAGQAAVEDAETRGWIAVTGDNADPQVYLAHPIYGEVRRRRSPTTTLRRLRSAVAQALAAASNSNEIHVLVRRAALILESDLPIEPQLMLEAAHGAVGLADLELAARLAHAAIAAGAGVEANFVHAHVLSWLGRGEDADATLAALDLDSLDPAPRARLVFLRSSNALWALGDPARAKSLVDAAAPEVPPPHRGCLDAFLAVHSFATNRPAEVTLWETADLQALPATAGAETAWVMTTVHGDAGRTSAAVASAETGYRAVAEAAEPPHVGFNIADSHMAALWLAGDVDGASRIAERVRAQAADLPGVAQPLGIAIAGRAALARGDIAAAVTLLDRAAAGLDDARALGWGYRYGIPRVTSLAMRGAVDDASALLNSLTETVRPFRPLDDEIDIARAWICAAGGGISAAVSLLLAAADRARGVGRFAVEVLCLQLAVQFGDDRRAPRLRELTTIVEGARAGLAARFAEALGVGDATQLASVAEGFEDAGDLVAALDATAHAAAAYRRQDRRGSALSCVSRAEELAARCGGVSTPALVQTREPVPLTSREREIVLLLGRGMSNRGIAEHLTLSVRTVESHIYRAMSRCGVNTREELAAVLRPRSQ